MADGTCGPPQPPAPVIPPQAIPPADPWVSSSLNNHGPHVARDRHGSGFVTALGNESSTHSSALKSPESNLLDKIILAPLVSHRGRICSPVEDAQHGGCGTQTISALNCETAALRGERHEQPLVPQGRPRSPSSQKCLHVGSGSGSGSGGSPAKEESGWSAPPTTLAKEFGRSAPPTALSNAGLPPAAHPWSPRGQLRPAWESAFPASPRGGFPTLESLGVTLGVRPFAGSVVPPLDCSGGGHHVHGRTTVQGGGRAV